MMSNQMMSNSLPLVPCVQAVAHGQEVREYRKLNRLWLWLGAHNEIVSRYRERARCVYTTYVRSQKGISG